MEEKFREFGFAPEADAEFLDALTSDYVLGPIAIPVAASVLDQIHQSATPFLQTLNAIQDEIAADWRDAEGVLDVSSNEVDEDGNVYPT